MTQESESKLNRLKLCNLQPVVAGSINRSHCSCFLASTLHNNNNKVSNLAMQTCKVQAVIQMGPPLVSSEL